MNGACYSAAVPFLYWNLTIQISSHQKLQEDSTELEENSLRGQFLVHLGVSSSGAVSLLAEEEGALVKGAAKCGYSEGYDVEFGEFQRDSLMGWQRKFPRPGYL